MIRPWYRSRLFWLGLPGLVFLLWAWGRSNTLSTHTVVQPGWLCSTQGKLLWYGPSETMKRPIRVDFREGDIVVSDVSFIEFFGVPEPSGFTTTEPVLATDRRWFPPPRWRSGSFEAGASFRFLSLPYWLLTGAYVAVWLGALVGWQRRKARLSKTPAVPPP